MVNNITYLLGAGASYNSLPLINSMNVRMTAYSKFLKTLKENGKLQHRFLDTFITELDTLIENEENNTSIDIYAKTLQLQQANSIKLTRLKALLSSYLIFEQMIKPDDLVLMSEEFADISVLPQVRSALNTGLQKAIKNPIDKRYKAFLVERLNQERRLPDNVKIISWNYDMQIEAAYSNITNANLTYTQDVLQVFPSERKTIDTTRSCILKLNGTAGLVRESDGTNIVNWFDLRRDELMENLNYLINIVERNYQRTFNEPQFYFSWEENDVVSKTRNWAKEIIKSTDVLIVIGYSFPSYNINVDRQLFKDTSRLKGAFYQINPSDFKSATNRLEAINPRLSKKIELIDDLSVFHFPHVFTPEEQMS